MSWVLFSMAAIMGLVSCSVAVREYPRAPDDHILSALLFIAAAVLLVGGAIVRAVMGADRKSN